MALLDYEETYKLKIIEATDFVAEKRIGVSLKEREKVALLLYLDNRGDGIAEKPGVSTHALTVASLTVKLAAQFHDRLRLPFAEHTQAVKQVFGFEMVYNHLGILTDIDHIERMQSVLAVDIHGIVTVL